MYSISVYKGIMKRYSRTLGEWRGSKPFRWRYTSTRRAHLCYRKKITLVRQQTKPDVPFSN